MPSGASPRATRTVTARALAANASRPCRGFHRPRCSRACRAYMPAGTCEGSASTSGKSASAPSSVAGRPRITSAPPSASRIRASRLPVSSRRVPAARKPSRSRRSSHCRLAERNRSARAPCMICRASVEEAAKENRTVRRWSRSNDCARSFSGTIVLAAANTRIEGAGWASDGALPAQSTAPTASPRTAAPNRRAVPFRPLPEKSMDASIANSTRVSYQGLFSGPD